MAAFSGAKGSGGFLNSVQGLELSSGPVTAATKVAPSTSLRGTSSHIAGKLNSGTNGDLRTAAAAGMEAVAASSSAMAGVTKPLGFYFEDSDAMGPGHKVWEQHVVMARIKAALLANESGKSVRPLGFYFGLNGKRGTGLGANGTMGVAAAIAEVVAARQGQPLQVRHRRFLLFR